MDGALNANARSVHHPCEESQSLLYDSHATLSLWRKDNEIFLTDASEKLGKVICEQQNRFCEVLTINYHHDRLISGLFSQ